MKTIFKWYRFPGLLIIFVGLYLKYNNQFSGLPSWIWITTVIIGAMITLTDILKGILNFEIMMWTPLWEFLGMTIGAILLFLGLGSIICGGLVNLGTDDYSSIYWGIGLLIGGGVIVAITRGIKSRNE